MIGDYTTSRVSRQRKHNSGDARAIAVGFGGYSGEGGGFAWFHGYAAKVDGSAQRALERGFEEIEFAHADAAGGDDDIYFAGCVAEGLFEGAWSVLVVCLLVVCCSFGGDG